MSTVDLHITTTSIRMTRKTVLTAECRERKVIIELWGDPVKSVVYAIFLQHPKLKYQRGQGLTVPISPDDLEVLSGLNRMAITWQMLAKNKVIPNPTLPKLLSLIQIHPLIKMKQGGAI